MGENAYGNHYDPIRHQMSAKPKRHAAPGYRAFEAARTRGVRSGIPRRSGNRYRMTSAVSNNLLRVVNTYDHQSRRIRKEVSRRDAETQSWELERAHTFLYDGWNVIRETIQTPHSTTVDYYTCGNDLSGTEQGAGGVGGLLAVTRVSSDTSYLSPLTYYPLYDANGNVTAYLDATGAVVARREYDPFGNTADLCGTMAGEFAHWFSTKYLEQEAGMYYYGYRFYHPELGRWVSRDPMEEDGGYSLYVVCQNSTINYGDALGHHTWDIDKKSVSVLFSETFAILDWVSIKNDQDVVERGSEWYLDGLFVEVRGRELHSGGDCEKHEDEHVVTV